MGKKYVYMFSEGNKDMRELLGGKGANLAEMTKAGMPVPQGFTVSTEACTQYYNDGRQINDDIQQQIYDGLAKMEEICGKKFAAARLRAFGRARFHARHDGHHPQSGP